MPFAAAASEKNSLSTAIQETVQMISGELGRVPDLTIAFVSQHHAKNFPSMAASIVCNCSNPTAAWGTCIPS